MPTLENKIKNKKARIGVVGLGYVGLPLAVEYANNHPTSQITNQQSAIDIRTARRRVDLPLSIVEV